LLLVGLRTRLPRIVSPEHSEGRSDAFGQLGETPARSTNKNG